MTRESKGNTLHELQRWRASIFSYLQKNPPVVPIKYQYVGKGAQRWRALTEYEKYISRDEVKLLKDSKGEIASTLRRATSGKLKHGKAIRVVDVGCGTGEKAAIILSEISKSFRQVSYLPIDISREVIRMAMETVSKLGVSVRTYKGEVIDYEIEILAPSVNVRRSKNPDLLLFLGNNLGNIENSYEEVIIKISESMRSGIDLLLLGIELASVSSEEPAYRRLLQVYGSAPTVKFLSTALEPFGVLPLKLDKRRGCGSIYPTLQNSELHIYFKFTKQKRVSLRGTGIYVQFHRGDRIHLAKSKRFSLEEVTDLLGKHGLRLIHVWKAEGSLSTLMLCSKG